MAAPIITFTGTPLGGVPGTVVTFTALVTGSPESWFWSFGDATSGSTLQNPTHQYNAVGVYTVSASGITSGGTGILTRSNYITIASTPTIAASANHLSVLVGATVEFTDTSTNDPTSWSWDFGDGTGTSTDQNPTYQYTAVGTYTVTLTASNVGGSGTATLTINVLPLHNFTNKLRYRAVYPVGTWDTSQPSYSRIVHGEIDRNA